MATRTIGFLLFDNIDEPDFIGALDVFNTSHDIAQKTGNDTANRTLLMSLSGKDIISTRGLHIPIDCSLASARALDLLCLVGGEGVPTQIENKQLLDQLAALAVHSTWIACMGNGIHLLSATGLIDDKKRAPLGSRSPYVRDGNLLTSTGATAGIDICLWLIGRLHSIPLALATQRTIHHQRNSAISAFG